MPLSEATYNWIWNQKSLKFKH